MKVATGIFCVSALLLGAHLFAHAAVCPADDPIRLRDLDRYVRITQQPFEMHDTTIEFCRPPEQVALNPHEPAHPKTAFCHVYVNALAKDTMISGKGVYPEGSIVIKSKLAAADDQTPELFTVMQKMADGYDTEHGNWKYAVVDGATYRQVAAGRIDSCIECHVQYEEMDYITREYMAEKPPTK